METKIDRGFFNTQKAYEKMLGGKIYESAQHGIIGCIRPICESIDEKGYKSYIVVKCKDGSEKIESGWEYSEDAKDRKNELKEDGILSKCVSRRYLKSVGLDPSDDSNWFKGNVGILSEIKNESVKRYNIANGIFENCNYNEYENRLEKEYDELEDARASNLPYKV